MNKFIYFNQLSPAWETEEIVNTPVNPTPQFNEGCPFPEITRIENDDPTIH